MSSQLLVLPYSTQHRRCLIFRRFPIPDFRARVRPSSSSFTTFSPLRLISAPLPASSYCVESVHSTSLSAPAPCLTLSQVPLPIHRGSRGRVRPMPLVLPEILFVMPSRPSSVPDPFIPVYFPAPRSSQTKKGPPRLVTTARRLTLPLAPTLTRAARIR